MSRDQEWWETQDGDDAWQHQQMQEALRREEEERAAEQEIKELEDDLRKWDEEHDDGALFVDGMEAALIGVGVQFSREIAIYDYDKCLDILIERDNMDVEAAIEYMEYNVLGAYAGKGTPIFLIRKEPYQDDTETKQDSTEKKQITVQLEFNF